MDHIGDSRSIPYNGISIMVTSSSIQPYGMEDVDSSTKGMRKTYETDINP